MTRARALDLRWATAFLAVPLAACLTGTPLNRADSPIDDHTVIVPLGLDLVAAVPDDTPLRLTAAERADVIAFLEALSSELEGTLARAEQE